MTRSIQNRPALAGLTLFVLGLATSAVAYFGLHRHRAFQPLADAVELVAPADSGAAPPVPDHRGTGRILLSTDYVLPRGSGSLLSPFTDRSERDWTAKTVRLLTTRFFGSTLKVFAPGATLPWNDLLSNGRAPTAGEPEVAVGNAAEGDTLDIGGTSFRVVGRFRGDVEVLRRSVVAYDGPLLEASIRSAGLRSARVLLVEGEAGRRRSGAATDATRIIYSRRLRGVDFLVYLIGVAMLYCGGILVSWWSIRRLSVATLPAIVRDAVAFLAEHPRRFVALNAIYFGTVIVLHAVAYFASDLQAFGFALGQALISSGSGELGWAGTAYQSGNIAYAAAVTLLINFSVGAVRDITLPSMVVPGAGAVLGVLRAVVWGIVLSPTIDPIAHKFKVVNFLEGEGYVIAIIFATELFVAMRAREGGRLQNYRRAVMLNLRSLVLVAAVLALSAVVEATILLRLM
jgi:hypothetical protein